MKWDKPIKTEKKYKKAFNRLSSILDANPDSPEGMEAELLATLIEKYEKEHYPIALPELLTAIKEAMEMKVLKDKDLIPAIGLGLIVYVSSMNMGIVTYTAKSDGEVMKIFNYPETLHLKKGETVKFLVRYPGRSVILSRGIGRLNYQGRP